MHGKGSAQRPESFETVAAVIERTLGTTGNARGHVSRAAGCPGSALSWRCAGAGAAPGLHAPVWACWWLSWLLVVLFLRPHPKKEAARQLRPHR